MILSIGFISASYAGLYDKKLVFSQYNVADDFNYLCLEGYYSFNENIGENVHDQSINEIDGSLKPNSAIGPGWTIGKISYALEFDGLGDFVEVPDDPCFDMADEITIMMWIKSYQWDNAGQQYNIRNIIDKGEHNTGNAFGIYSYKESNDDFKLHFRINKDENADVSAALPAIDDWHHIAATYNSEFLRLYIDGDKVAEKAYDEPIQINDQKIYVGGAVGRQYWFNGIIDEVKIYSCALTTEDILHIYDLEK